MICFLIVDIGGAVFLALINEQARSANGRLSYLTSNLLSQPCNDEKLALAVCCTLNGDG